MIKRKVNNCTQLLPSSARLSASQHYYIAFSNLSLKAIEYNCRTASSAELAEAFKACNGSNGEKTSFCEFYPLFSPINIPCFMKNHSYPMSYEFAEGYKIRDQSAPHFLTFSIIGWIDIFSRQRYRDIMLESMQFCRVKKGLTIGAYVIMSNHIHTIWTAANNNLSDVIRDFKTFTSKAITETIATEPESRRDWLLYMFQFYANRTAANDKFKVWTSNNHPEEIHSESFMRTKLNYIHENPVRAGLVTEASHYLYSSAANYEGKKGLIEIDFLF